ncbi:hypothetical protein KIN20_037033 [Parelaphostrongylus tenuis]|uniref:Uncharacterized protein n=1 Tax=Parelaphostrongylus tenuis TaxID=148309 RepID=A0AAD5WL05_PARTN|nr:hypothetical protein KIN20_037033 [Parelaphostrongylus tenuis]
MPRKPLTLYWNENEKLPLALRLVENADLTSTLTEQPTLPIFSFRNDDMLTFLVSSAQKRDSPTENANSNIRTASKSGSSFKGLISLAPIVPTPSNATVVKNETEEKPTNEVMKKLHEALDRLKLRRAIGGHLMETQQSENSERLVPMPNAKKYAGIQKLRISEADKVMIRPTYQKYFYETQMDDDMYDDEYDDEYEQKEFVVEPLNAELLSDESDEEGSCEVTDLTTISKSGQQRKAVDGDRTSTVGNSTSDGTKRESVVGDKQTAGTGAASRSNYTGGRQRQIKERHKNAFKQRGADRKMRGMY